MKIKQQKQVKSYLIEEFGPNKGNEIFDKQEKELYKIIKKTKDKTENQMKTLIQTILPRIALYKVLLNEEFSKEDVYQYMRKYMIDKIAAKKHASTAKMELVPGFYKIYSFIFLKTCVQQIYKKTLKAMVKIIMMLRLLNVYGIQHARKMAVKSCVICFVMWMM